MATQPYATCGWKPVPLSMPRTRLEGWTVAPTGAMVGVGGDVVDENDDDGRSIRKVGRMLWTSCGALGLLVTVLLTATAVAYVVENHRLLVTLSGGGDKAIEGDKGAVGGVTASPFPSTPNFLVPPSRVAFLPTPKKWRPFYHQWACGQSHTAFQSDMLAAPESFADEQIYTSNFIGYTDIVRDYLPTAPRLQTCSTTAGLDGSVSCIPFTEWSRTCQPGETADSSMEEWNIQRSPSSPIPPRPCETGWQDPSLRTHMAVEGHAYCARFCDGFPNTRYFNVRVVGPNMGCYCLSQCLGDDNPVVSSLNGVAGSNQWDVWALDEEGFTPKFSAELAV